MYHVLVVDDEPLMRTYLSRCIPACCGDFDVPAVSPDGVDAVKKLRETTFHVLITDIKMPGMDGLDLTRYVREHYPEIIVIIISGYTDFEYARKAIQYQVIDYLVKPLVDSQLIGVLREISKRLSASEKGSTSFLKVYSPGNPKKGSAIKAILDKDNETIQMMIDKHQIESELGKQYFCLMNCKRVQTIEKPSEFFQYQLFSELCELVKDDHMIPIFTADQYSLVYLEGNTSKNLQDRAAEISSKITALHGENALSVVVSDPVDDPLLLARSHEEILKDRTMVLISEKGEFFEWQKELLLSRYQTFQKCCNQVISSYKSGSFEQVKIHLEIMLDNVPLSMNKYEFILILGYLCEKASAPVPYQYYAIHKNEIRADTFRNLIIEAFLQTMKRKNQDFDTPLIQQAVEFIKLHYQENISLSDVARECNVTSSYLSDLFHKEMHLPYSKYLTQLRMEQAKLLLDTYDSIKIYDVAQKIGYTSSKHFIKVFKQFYGISPALYQKTHVCNN